MIKHFNRFELKYIVPVATRDALVDKLRPHVFDDPSGGPRSSYWVTSLYYDSPDLTCLRAKLDGVRYRRKLRIRRYGELTEANPLVMVEIKQRIGRTTQKRRLEARLDAALRVCAADDEMQWSDAADQAVASEVGFLVRSLLLQPTCVIGYVRQAFIGNRYESGLRITFDHGLWSAVPSHGLSADAGRHSFLPPDRFVLEVKANNKVPLWVTNMLARHDCVLTRYSKYCSGVTRLIELGHLPSDAWASNRLGAPPGGFARWKDAANG